MIKQALAVMLVGLLLASCDTSSANQTAPTPSVPTAVTAITETPFPEATPTNPPAATPTSWLAPVLSADVHAVTSAQLFFMNGPDLWLLDADSQARQVTREQRISMFASAPDGSRAIIVVPNRIGGRDAQEIRFVTPDGSVSEPLRAPIFTSGPAAGKRLAFLSWSDDGGHIALIYEGATVDILDAAHPDQGIETLHPSKFISIDQIAWAPSGTAIVLLGTSTMNIGMLEIAAIDGSHSTVLEPRQSFGQIAWPANQAQFIIGEDLRAGPGPAAGSIFRLDPISGNRMLLVSGGEFASVTRIAQLASSRDGHWLAFSVQTPGAGGQFEFHSLWLFDLQEQSLRRIQVGQNIGITDLWWTSRGLVWRELESPELTTYNGSEPFALGLYSLDQGQSKIVFRASAP